MIVDELVRNPGSWLAVRKNTGSIISSRVRLARNLKGPKFPEWADAEARKRLCAELHAAVSSLDLLAGALSFDIGELDAVDREILQERHLISHELAARGAGGALIVSRDEQIAVMINEEDHLRLQAICPGLGLERLWQRIGAVDRALETRLAFAFSPRLGYLTACPSNVGTGLRASVMMHLVGLRLTGEVDAVLHGLEKLDLAVRGLSGEGSEASGNMFQISNQSTLGAAEEDIVRDLVRVVAEVAGHEQNARARLLEGNRRLVFDQVGRAYGLLRQVRILPSVEAVDLFSALRMGVEFGMIRGLTVRAINEILLLTQPGHLQKISGRCIDAEERDAMRADIVRQKLSEVSMTE